MFIKSNQKRQLSKKRIIVSLLGIGVTLIVSVSLAIGRENLKGIVQIKEIHLNNKIYTLILKNQHLYIERPNTKELSLFLEEAILDMTYYDLNQDEKEELLVLTLDQDPSPVEGRRFGKELQFYVLDVQSGELEATLMYKNDISSVHPFSLRAGKLEKGGAYSNLFVGVYKDTKYYKNVINRPFFFSWNGKFIERKWTGSYLSHNELMDLVFVDLTGDGADEVAVLEKTQSGTYQVSLYKWLNFGFEYLTTSTGHYSKQGVLKLEKQGEQMQIKLLFPDGKEEAVDF